MSKTKKALATHITGLIVIAVAVLGLISISSGAEPTQGTVVSTAAQTCVGLAGCPYTSVTASSPYSSGQDINIVVPATENATGTGPLFSSTQTLEVVECSAPNGVVPTSSNACDGNTALGSGTLFSNADGSLNYLDSVGVFYTVYSTPNTALGDTATSPACGNTAATECILFIGVNDNDFTSPHVWSQPFFVSANADNGGEDPGDGSAPATTITPQPTSLATSLSGGGQSGTGISVPTGTAVTDTATLSGTNAATATGTVTYNVYSDSGCTTLAPGGGTAETITTPGTLPASAPVTLSTAGTYYWGVSYSGDSADQSSTSTCGTSSEVETVTAATTTPQPTSLATSLSGGGQSGTGISVPTGTAVTDTATLSGTNAATATGTVTYNVYSDSGCTTLAPGGGTAETITTPGTLPASAPVTLSTAGTFYWGVSYSGDSADQSSTSTCGTSSEVETVTAATTTKPKWTDLMTSLKDGASPSGRTFPWENGRIVEVVSGASVTDTARLIGPNTSSATGTVAYTLYTRQVVTKNHHQVLEWEVFGTAGTINVSAGQVPDSNPMTVPVGVYEWQALYSGDSANKPSKSPFGSETEIVVPSSHCDSWQKAFTRGCLNGTQD